MAFMEFYADASGANGASNMNAGDKTTSPVTTTNGAYTRGAGAGGTDQFVAASGTPFATAVAGDYISIYNDGATTPAFIGAITTVNSSTSIDISLTKIAGTRPADAANGKTATLGGAWLGPNAGVAHPFNFITTACTDTSGNTYRVNFKSGTNYAITGGITHSLAGPGRFQGYTTTAGDGGRATIDGTIVGASYAMLTISGANIDISDFILQNNGTTGQGNGLVMSGGECVVKRVVVNNVRGVGIHSTNSAELIVECETYACNLSNTAALGGFISASSIVQYLRCIAHDNAGSNTSGFGTNVSPFYTDCIADTNGAHGFSSTGSGTVHWRNCDTYNNVGDGINLNNSSGAMFFIENCNFVKNGAYGINGAGAGTKNGEIVNCGFGSGTMANVTADTVTLGSMNVSGSVTYPANVTPWNDPANGDFRLTSKAAIGTGRGSFTETQTSYSGTTGYPDIGAGQHDSTKLRRRIVNGRSAA